MFDVFYVFLVPIYVLPILFVAGIIRLNCFVKYIFCFTLAGINFIITKNILISSLILVLLLALLTALRLSYNVLFPYGNKTALNKVIVIYNFGCESVVSDGTKLFKLKVKSKQGSVVDVGFECF